MLPVCKLWMAQNLFRPARLCFNQPYLRGVHVNDNNVLVGGSVILAFWKLMCIPSVSAQPCSNDANLLLEAPWAQQVGWTYLWLPATGQEFPVVELLSVKCKRPGHWN